MPKFKSPYTQVSTKTTPQSEPIPGSTQIPNNAGGYAWKTTNWQQLDRFLILGSAGGTFYIGEQTLTKDNATALIDCIQEDGLKVVNRIVEVSDKGLAPKNDPALFALAAASALGDVATRRAACEAIPKVARIGTHLFHLIAFREQFGGWGGKGLFKRAIQKWYLDKNPNDLAYQLLKYQSRDSWSHRDVLRLAHPKPVTDTQATIFKYVVAGTVPDGLLRESDEGKYPRDWRSLIFAYEMTKAATQLEDIINIENEFKLEREFIPSQWLKYPEVWKLLLKNFKIHALIRNLANLSQDGILGPAHRDVINYVVETLRNETLLRTSRVHPLELMIAARVYGGGRIQQKRGWKEWEVVSQVVDVLDDAVYTCIPNVDPTHKEYIIAVDASGSMQSPFGSAPGFSCREAAVALAMILQKVEPHTLTLGFTEEDHIKVIPLSPKQRLNDAMKTFREMIKPEGTDVALPFYYAINKGIRADVFVILTDSETWVGKQHPQQAFDEYRRKYNPKAKCVIVSMAANLVTVGDPNDIGVLQAVGFDASLMQVMRQFVMGEF